MNKQILKDIIGEAKTIVEIGSYDGKDARQLHKIFGCTVQCFEPNVKSFKKSKGTVLIDTLIGDKTKDSVFYESNHPQSNSIRPPSLHKKIWPKIKFKQSKCRMMRLDEFLFFKGIDLLWIDVNGAEANVIEGATSTLLQTRFVYMEVSEKELYGGQVHVNRIIRRMRQLGFIVNSIYDFGENFGNILFENIKMKYAI